MECANCDKTIIGFSYTCKFCNKKFCSKSCSLPENHSCNSLKKIQDTGRRGFVLDEDKLLRERENMEKEMENRKK